MKDSMKGWYWVVALVFAVAGGATAVWHKTQPPAFKTLSDYHLRDLDGRMTHNLAGDNERLLVNFWATWCIPCLRELPLLAEAADGFDAASARVGVVAVSYETAEEILAYAREHAIALEMYSAPLSILRYLEEAGNPTKALPFSVMLDRDERIIARHIGDFKSVAQIEEFARR